MWFPGEQVGCTCESLEDRATMIDYQFGISAIDAHYTRPIMAAIHLVVEDGRCAIIDAANNAALPHVLETLSAKGLALETVDYLILTHVHLDHAGGAGLLMQRLPNARLVVHPRGARHMADPAKLIEGSEAVYGKEAFARLYGTVLPIAVARMIEAPDGFSVELGSHGRRLSFVDTPGHARHHMAVHDNVSGHLFTGDTFGLSYREFDVVGRPSIFPSTSPVQFNPEQAHRSIDRILAYHPQAVYVTHFGQVHDVERLGQDMHRLIDAHAAIAQAEMAIGKDGGRPERLRKAVFQLACEERVRQGWPVSEGRMFEVLGLDLELNAAGLESWIDGQEGQVVRR